MEKKLKKITYNKYGYRYDTMTVSNEDGKPVFRITALRKQFRKPIPEVVQFTLDAADFIAMTGDAIRMGNMYVGNLRFVPEKGRK